MSGWLADGLPGLSPEDIEAAQRRDRRFQQTEFGIEVESQLRDSGPLKLLVAKLAADADAAMREFAIANCGDTVLIQGLQSRVFRLITALDTFESIINQGRAATSELIAEDMAERERFD